MALIKRIHDDLNAARKARDDAKKTMLLNTLYGEASKVIKDATGEVTDSDILAVVKKFIKNAEQTINDLKKVGRDAGHIQTEIDILRNYLPAPVSETAIEDAVKEIVAGLDADNPKAALGLVLKGLKGRFGDLFDGNVMVPVAKRILET